MGGGEGDISAHNTTHSRVIPEARARVSRAQAHARDTSVKCGGGGGGVLVLIVQHTAEFSLRLGLIGHQGHWYVGRGAFSTVHIRLFPV